MTTDTHGPSITKSTKKTERLESFWIEWTMPDTHINNNATSAKGNGYEGKEGREHYYCEWN